MFDARALSTDFGQAAAQYAWHAHVQRRVLSEAAGLAVRYIPDNAFVLDLGCGTMPLVAVEKGKNWRCIGLDRAQTMCAETHLRYAIPCVVADAAQIPFKEACADAVFSSLMLQWAKDPRAVLQECARVLRPQGVVALATFTRATLQELRGAFTALNEPERVSEFPCAQRLAQEAASAGFTVEDAKTVVDREHYPDLNALMHALKAIGATNKRIDRRRGLTAPSLFEAAQHYYAEHYGEASGLPVTWEIRLMALRR